MDFRGIPVRTIGPGSQPEEPEGGTISYIDMPKDMSMYQPPRTLPQESVAGLAGARETMFWLRGALADYNRTQEPQLANLSALDPDSREIVNQILSEGEVSITCSGEVRARTQESILAGVWRTHFLDEDDQVIADLLEVGDVPHYVRTQDNQARDIIAGLESPPSDVSNALPILVELDTYRQQYSTGQSPKVINLSLLPLDDADLLFLDEKLGHGPVDILSRSYGKCQVSSTLVQNVWWVRYYNSMSVLILNTLEVAEVPLVACAAAEDLRDSAIRLDEILEPYWSDVA